MLARGQKATRVPPGTKCAAVDAPHAVRLWPSLRRRTRSMPGRPRPPLLSAVLRIQRQWRRCVTLRQFRAVVGEAVRRHRRRNAAVLAAVFSTLTVARRGSAAVRLRCERSACRLQRHWRERRRRTSAALLVADWWVRARATLRFRAAVRLVVAGQRIQRWWRAAQTTRTFRRLVRDARRVSLAQQACHLFLARRSLVQAARAATRIQRWWRGARRRDAAARRIQACLVTVRQRRALRTVLAAARALQLHWRRRRYTARRDTAARALQLHWRRRYYTARRDAAARTVQRHWRRRRALLRSATNAPALTPGGPPAPELQRRRAARGAHVAALLIVLIVVAVPLAVWT